MAEHNDKQVAQILNPSPQRVKCFVIQPFGIKTDPLTKQSVNNDEVYEALRKLETVRPTFPITVYRANTHGVKAEDLHEQVVISIRESDFCIADFTGRNSNVVYETGFAKGLGRRVILLCQNRDDIPTDLKGALTVRYRMDDLAHLANDIDPHLDGIKESVMSRRQSTWAQVEFFAKRDDAQIREKIGGATEKIDILQTNLAVIQGNYLPNITETMRKRNNLRLRLLTLDPQSIFVNYRGQQLGFKDNIGLYRGELDANLRSVHHHLRSFGDRVEIKIYDDFPTQIVFFFDNEVLACVVSATGRARENCAFLLQSQTPGAQKSFIDHFNYLWEEKSVKYKPD